LGTHIDGYFPRTVERCAETIRTRLSEVFAGMTGDLMAIRNGGRFSATSRDWYVVEGDERNIWGEGPSGFSINVYPRVVEFTCIERFGAIAGPEYGIPEALRRVFAAVAAGLGEGRPLAVAAGGFGDTDRAGDLACDGAAFTEVCASLEAVIGPPARRWKDLEAGTGDWYLSVPA
jgi:hypothetical protein